MNGAAGGRQNVGNSYSAGKVNLAETIQDAEIYGLSKTGTATA